MQPCVLLILIGCLSIRGMAVDQSKFRNCDKTSFCRRHRGNRASRLYNYRLDVSSIQFHFPSKEFDESKKEDTEKVEGETGGIWRSLQDRFYGGGQAESNRIKDPYVRGPPPTLTGFLVNTNAASETSSGIKEKLEWSLHAMADGIVRMRVTEVYLTPETPFENARVTYDEVVLATEAMAFAEHAHWIQPGDPYLVKIVGQDHAENYIGLQYSDAEDEPGMFVLVRIDSFAVFLYRETALESGPIVSLGEQNMMHFEVRRLKESENRVNEDVIQTHEDEEGHHANQPKEGDKPEKEIVGYWEDGLAIYSDGTREKRKNIEEDHRQLTEVELDKEGMWDEKFQSHHDSKPHGPMSVGMDIVFPNSSNLYGLPEHASSTKLKTTRGENSEYNEPYRLYNLDVFEYDLDVPMALYGAVPLVVSQSMSTGTTGVFWFNPTETFVDIVAGTEGKSTVSHWMSESGVVDLFLIPGPTPRDFYRQYGTLTGTMPLPPMFSLGYHQCRWNYKDEQDVYFVHGKFEELDYPYDVLWLDIEHTDGKRYFTWDKNLFPNPVQMQEKLWSQGRRMVTIVDPHTKRDDNYYVHKEATSKGVYIKDKDGKKDYSGWCWPGDSSYTDFTSAQARSWFADQFGYDRYKGSTPSLFTWNDMNEPSVFNGPEVSMQKDLLNLNGEEHREWHNLYGMLFHRATMEGLIRRNKPDENMRPFVLSRAFFAGSQLYGAIWTGDNAAEWSHLEIASSMLLSLNVGALSFVGADVGGFFGNTDAELMTRWMQAGAYTPFFRGHAHHDSKRREPWMFGEETMIRLRKAAMDRYALLPYWYNTFREAGETGMPVMRTMWMQYPKTESLFESDDQYMIGADLLVKPVTTPGATESVIRFPSDDSWYDSESLHRVSRSGDENRIVEMTLPSDINKIPVFQRGGSIIARKLRHRRSSEMMKKDPYTLYVALDDSRVAAGTLYMDDEESFSYELKGAYAESSLSADFTGPDGMLTNTVWVGPGWTELVTDFESDRMVERIVVMGVESNPRGVSSNSQTVHFNYEASSNVLVLRKPGVSALTNWEIEIAF